MRRKTMKTARAWLALLSTGMGAGMMFVVAGCSTPQDTAVLGGLLGGLAPYSKTPQGAASMAAMGNAAGGFANAQASRSQIVIQNGGSGSGSMGSPATVYVVPTPVPAVEPDQFGTINVLTEVESCDIISDGAFVGNTPAMLKLYRRA
jgi:hypothetical protein